MEKLMSILPQYINKAIKKLNSFQISNLTEIRLRVNKPAYMYISGIEYGINENGISKYDGIIFSKEDSKEMWRRLCEGSPYSTTIKQRSGYITVAGNRVGFCGEYALLDDKIKHIEKISSFCVRIKHEVKGCSNKFFRYLFDNNEFENTLIVSPPGCGKTTMIRDMARLLSFEGYNVCVVDERDEIAACIDGVPTLDVGKRTDVFCNVKKTVAIENIVRSLRPDIIIVDELGDQNDILSITQASKKGVKLISTIHGKNINDVIEYQQMFDRFVFLSKKEGVGTVDGIYNKQFKNVVKNIC